MFGRCFETEEFETGDQTTASVGTIYKWVCCHSVHMILQSESVYFGQVMEVNIDRLPLQCTRSDTQNKFHFSKRSTMTQKLCAHLLAHYEFIRFERHSSCAVCSSRRQWASRPKWNELVSFSIIICFWHLFACENEWQKVWWQLTTIAILYLCYMH